MSDEPDLSMRVVTVAAPVRTQVVESLRDAITEGRLSPGRRLIEKELCQLLGVSRPSVREALRALEAEGLVSTIPNRGPVVTKLTPSDAASIYEVRAALESLAAELFAEKASMENIADLQRAAEKLYTAYDTQDVKEMLVAKREFYDVIFQGSNNQIIPEVLRTMNARITRLRAVGLTSPERRRASRKEISELVEALTKRKRKTAASASKRHVEQAAKIALASLEN